MTGILLSAGGDLIKCCSAAVQCQVQTLHTCQVHVTACRYFIVCSLYGEAARSDAFTLKSLTQIFFFLQNQITLNGLNQLE